ncbi:MAG: hypothetical protein J1E07_09740 [Treponema sp.]|nr:hypothetical protein [Treponema sp.]
MGLVAGCLENVSVMRGLAADCLGYVMLRGMGMPSDAVSVRLMCVETASCGVSCHEVEEIVFV